MADRGPVTATGGGALAGIPAGSVIDEASRQLRAPWAASIAGLLFAALFTGALALLQNSPMFTANDVGILRIFATGEDLPVLVGGMYLAPLAGVAFLWFIAVIRDQIGEREDRFFATVFFGSGLLFVAMLFASAAAVSAVVVGFRYLGERPPSAATIGMMRALGYTFAFAFSTRAAAIFLIATATIGIRSRVFPRWFAVTGYALGAVLLFVMSIWALAILVLPIWVALVSLFILRREWSHRRNA